jgi:hypothetical protein
MGQQGADLFLNSLLLGLFEVWFNRLDVESLADLF